MRVQKVHFLTLNKDMARKSSKKKESPEKHFSTEKPEFCVYEIYRKSNKTVYYLQELKGYTSS